MSDRRHPRIIKAREYARQGLGHQGDVRPAPWSSGLPVQTPAVSGGNGSGDGLVRPGPGRPLLATELGEILKAMANYRSLVRAEADMWLAKAKQEAARIRAEAQAEGDRLREEARREGFLEGYRTGEEEGRKAVLEEVRTVLERLHQAVEFAERARRAVLEQARTDILKVALAIAEKVVRSELAARPEAVLRLVDEVLERWDGVDRIVIRCHPADAERISSYLEANKAHLASRTVEVRPGEDVEPGGCIVESRFGQLDAGVETRLGETGRRLMEWLQDEHRSEHR